MKTCYLCAAPRVFTRVKRVWICKTCVRSWALPLDPTPPTLAYKGDMGAALEEARRVMALDDKFNKYQPGYDDDSGGLPY